VHLGLLPDNGHYGIDITYGVKRNNYCALQYEDGDRALAEIRDIFAFTAPARAVVLWLSRPECPGRKAMPIRFNGDGHGNKTALYHMDRWCKKGQRDAPRAPLIACRHNGFPTSWMECYYRYRNA